MKTLRNLFSAAVILTAIDATHLAAARHVLLYGMARDVDAVRSKDVGVRLADRHDYRHCHYRARRVFCHT